MKLGPCFIIFGVLKNLLGISKFLKNLQAYEYFLNGLTKFT
jgi:hypothetical protein